MAVHMLHHLRLENLPLKFLYSFFLLLTYFFVKWHARWSLSTLFLSLSENGLMFSGPGQFSSPRDPQQKDLSWTFPMPKSQAIQVVMAGT